MWIYGSDWMVSVVKFDEKISRLPVKNPDPWLLLVRARFPGHLERFLSDYPEDIKNIIETPDADYRYRVAVKKKVFLDSIVDKALEIDYSNFKNSIPDSEEGYHLAALGAWNSARGQQVMEQSTRTIKRAKKLLRGGRVNREAEIEEISSSLIHAKIPRYEFAERLEIPVSRIHNGLGGFIPIKVAEIERWKSVAKEMIDKKTKNVD